MNQFSRTLRSLDQSGSTVTRAAAGAALALSLLLVGWAAFGSTWVYAATESARVEVLSSAYAVETEVAGRVTEVKLELGRKVRVGDVLVEIDSEDLKLDLKAQRVRLKTSKNALASLNKEIKASNDALTAYERAKLASLRASKARTNAVAAEAEAAQKEGKIYEELRKEQVATGLEALRSQGRASSSAAQVKASKAEVGRVSAVSEAEYRDRVAGILRLETQVVEIEGQISEYNTTIKRLEYEIDKRTLRATVEGTLADVEVLTPGATVTRGQKVASIVPPSDHRVVALFKPDIATGRIEEGQVGVLRLDAFPWAQYGIVRTQVTQAAREPRSGKVRVELRIDEYNEAIPLSHGMTGTVEVKVERVSALTLMARAAGQAIAGPVKVKPPDPTKRTKPPPSEMEQPKWCEAAVVGSSRSDNGAGWMLLAGFLWLGRRWFSARRRHPN